MVLVQGRPPRPPSHVRENTRLQMIGDRRVRHEAVADAVVGATRKMRERLPHFEEL